MRAYALTILASLGAQCALAAPLVYPAASEHPTSSLLQIRAAIETHIKSHPPLNTKFQPITAKNPKSQQHNSTNAKFTKPTTSTINEDDNDVEEDDEDNEDDDDSNEPSTARSKASSKRKSKPKAASSNKSGLSAGETAGIITGGSLAVGIPGLAKAAYELRLLYHKSNTEVAEELAKQEKQRTKQAQQQAKGAKARLKVAEAESKTAAIQRNEEIVQLDHERIVLAHSSASDIEDDMMPSQLGEEPDLPSSAVVSDVQSLEEAAASMRSGPIHPPITPMGHPKSNMPALASNSPLEDISNAVANPPMAPEEVVRNPAVAAGKPDNAYSNGEVRQESDANANRVQPEPAEYQQDQSKSLKEEAGAADRGVNKGILGKPHTPINNEGPARKRLCRRIDLDCPEDELYASKNSAEPASIDDPVQPILGETPPFLGEQPKLESFFESQIPGTSANEELSVPSPNVDEWLLASMQDADFVSKSEQAGKMLAEQGDKEIQSGIERLSELVAHA